MFKKPINLKCLCLPILFLYYENLPFPCFGNCIDFSLTQNIWETTNFGMFVFSHTFPVLWKSTFPTFWELYGFLHQPKYLKNPKIWNVFVFPYFSRTMEIHFPHVLGIVWISKSPKIFEKPITLECLCFPTLFPYYGNPLSPCFGNCMNFCFTHRIHERALRIVYRDKESTFKELLEKDNSVTVHVKNLQVLVTEMYKVQNNCSPKIKKKVFTTNEPIYEYHLRNTSDFAACRVKTVR